VAQSTTRITLTIQREVIVAAMVVIIIIVAIVATVTVAACRTLTKQTPLWPVTSLNGITN
jgi:hypothetical protein